MDVWMDGCYMHHSVSIFYILFLLLLLMCLHGCIDATMFERMDACTVSCLRLTDAGKEGIIDFGSAFGNKCLSNGRRWKDLKSATRPGNGDAFTAWCKDTHYCGLTPRFRLSQVIPNIHLFDLNHAEP